MFLLCFIDNFLFLFILTTQLLCWKNKTWRNTSLVSVLPALDKFLLYAHQHNFLVLSTQGNTNSWGVQSSLFWSVLRSSVCCWTLCWRMPGHRNTPFDSRKGSSVSKSHLLWLEVTPLSSLENSPKSPAPWCMSIPDGKGLKVTTEQAWTPALLQCLDCVALALPKPLPLVQGIFPVPSQSWPQSLPLPPPWFHLMGIWSCQQTLDAILC